MVNITDLVFSSSSSSSLLRTVATPWEYDVFLSFCGQDTREKFVSHLHNALHRRQVKTFIDDEMARGDSIPTALEKAIEGSSVAIVVFSPNYASSKWCLEELIKILWTRKAKGQMVMPVFLDVDPSEMQEQTGFLVEIMADHEGRYDSETVKQWRDAIREAANLAGWHRVRRGRSEAELVEKIVEEVSSKLRRPYFSVAKHPIGLDTRIEAIGKSLHVENDCVRMVGICGAAGIGKTTIAKWIYIMMADQFEGSSFLANVKEVSSRHGLHKLQETLLHDTLGDKTIHIDHVETGMNLIGQKLCNKRVLLVLDDVDSLEQLKGLVYEKRWFGLGSRVIITARDKDILSAHVSEIFEVPKLKYDHALQLFSWNAFRQPSPVGDLKPMSERFTVYAGGLPLALIVLGSYLYGKREPEWIRAFEILESLPGGRVDKILSLGYCGLTLNQKKIFLDIACLLKGEDNDEVIKTLHRCNFSDPKHGLEILAQKSFIYIEANKIWMHDLLQQMGQNFVWLECPEDPSKRSRLWSLADVQKVIRENLLADAIEGIRLDEFKQEEWLEAVKDLERWKELRLVIIKDILISRCPPHLCNQTNWLNEHGDLLAWISESCDPAKMTGDCSSQVANEQPLCDNLSEKLSGFKNFSMAELLHATKNFSEEIGFDGFGPTYRGVLDDGKEVAIKRAKYHEKSYLEFYQIFNAEITAGILKHRNLVQLVGFHRGDNEHALVFEYMKNGSLYDHLHNLQSSSLRSWKARLRVALDVAWGIEYLHENADRTMIHCDLNSSSILFDDKWRAKVSDFGKSVPVSESENVELVGTVGYVDKASINVNYYRLTPKADVYSYGVVLLELLSGRRAAMLEKEMRIVTIADLVVPLIKKEEISCVLDPNMPEPMQFELGPVKEVARLACSCVQDDPQDRPSMTDVANRVKRCYLSMSLSSDTQIAGVEDSC